MLKNPLEVRLHNLILRNPVMTASGTFGFGEEYADFVDMAHLGGIVVKGTTGTHREGNRYPRMAETPSGMLNAVGLQNKGVDAFCGEIYPRIKNFDTCVVVNVSGSSIEEYVEVARKINDLKHIPAIELNISCPNVQAGGMGFGTDANMAAKVVSEVRKAYHKTLIVKLTPNVTQIADIAKAVEWAGADVISLVNTVLGMAVDAEKQRPILSTITGGLSGPAIKPIALRCVWQVAKAVSIPLIGMGGIVSAADAIEFMLVGASAIQIGMANFINPAITEEVVAGMADYCQRHHIDDIASIVGKI